ncbi:MAG: hypothetical protein EOO39_02270 [Cytophagaceae bacterium]|nr:MAG: hypothetical protein EOO39_02270 [Cytophagaceae bacterium]
MAKQDNILRLEAPVLAEKLGLLKRFGEENPAIPAHKCVRLIARGGKLYLTYGTGSSSMTTTMAVPEHLNHNVCVDHRPLHNMVETMSGEVSIEVIGEEAKAVIRNKKTRAEMECHSGKIYPSPEKLEDTTVLQLSTHEAKMLAHALKRAAPFICTNDAKSDPYHAWVMPGGSCQTIVAAYDGLGSIYIEENNEVPAPSKPIMFTSKQINMASAMMLNVEPMSIALSNGWVSLSSHVEKVQLRRRQTENFMIDNMPRILTNLFDLTIKTETEPLMAFLRQALSLPKDAIENEPHILQWVDNTFVYKFDKAVLRTELDMEPADQVAQIIQRKGFSVPLLKRAVDALDTTHLHMNIGLNPNDFLYIRGVDYPDRLVVVAPSQL